MNSKLQILLTNFDKSLARTILLSSDCTPAVRDQVYNLAKTLGQLDYRIADCSLKIYARMGNVRKVEELIEQAGIDEVKPYTGFRSTLAIAHTAKGNTQEALKILRSIPNYSVKDYNFANHVLNLGHHPDGLQWCLEIFNNAKSLDQVIISNAQFHKSFSYLLNRVGRDDIGKMESLFEEMEKKGMKADELTFSSMIDAHVKYLNMNKAIELLEQSKRMGIVPCASSYHSILDGYVTMGDTVGEASWREKMKKDDCKLEVAKLNIQVRSLINQEKLEEALRLVVEASEDAKQPNVITFNTLINGFAKSNNMKQAQQLFTVMEERGITPSKITFNTLIKGYCKSGDVEHAQLELAKMEKRHMSPNLVTFIPIIQEYLNQGDLEQTHQTLHAMEKQNILPSQGMFDNLIARYRQQGKMDKASEVKEDMIRRGLQPGSQSVKPLRDGGK